MTPIGILLLVFMATLGGGMYLAGVPPLAALSLTAAATIAMMLICNEISLRR